MNALDNSVAGRAVRGEKENKVLLRLEKASFGYGGPPVITGIDFSVFRGDFTGIVGPNGAGKTTLLRGMIGVLKPIEGKLIYGDNGKKPFLGYVPQVQSLDPIFPLTVAEVVSMGAWPTMKRIGFMKEQDREFLGEKLVQVGMEKERKKLFGDLSAGQKQRVLIARSLMVRPDLLLLDEPTSGVDQAAEEAVMGLLGELNRRGLAVVMVCHEMKILGEHVREIAWISRGKIERGRTREMLSAHKVREKLTE